MNKKALLGLMLCTFYNYGSESSEAARRELADDSGKIPRELKLARTPRVIDKKLVQTYMGMLDIKEAAKDILDKRPHLEDFDCSGKIAVKQGLYLYSYRGSTEQWLLTPWGLVRLWVLYGVATASEFNRLREQLTLEFVRNEGEKARGVSPDIFYVKNKTGIHQKSIAELEKYRGKDEIISTRPPDFPSIYKITAVKGKPLPEPQEFLPGDGRSETVRSCEWKLLKIFFGQESLGEE